MMSNYFTFGSDIMSEIFFSIVVFSVNLQCLAFVEIMSNYITVGLLLELG